MTSVMFCSSNNCQRSTQQTRRRQCAVVHCLEDLTLQSWKLSLPKKFQIKERQWGREIRMGMEIEEKHGRSWVTKRWASADRTDCDCSHCQRDTSSEHRNREERQRGKREGMERWGGKFSKEESLIQISVTPGENLTVLTKSLRS